MDKNAEAMDILDRVTRAHMSLSSFLAKAGVGSSTFYRWMNNEAQPSRVTRQKLIDAVEAL